MDFIERVLHVSPDGGSGTLELFILLVPVIAGSLYILIKRKRHHHS